MNVPQSLRRRINFQGDFELLLSDVASTYTLGKFISFEIIDMGYEDLNIKLTTTTGNYFVKIFSELRDDPTCLRLINIVKTAIDSGVSHPPFLQKETGYIYRARYEDFNIRLAVFEFIEGKTFFELKRNPTTPELKQIIKMASLVNEIGYKPAELYDPWALLNFTAEYKRAHKYLDEKLIKVLDSLNEAFKKVDIKSLPCTLVHGDLISTNIMKDGKDIYFVDFSVANYYPRIVELAVLMSDIMFDPKNVVTVEKYYSLLLSEYQLYQKLSKVEIEMLPLFIQLAHAMHIVGATIEKEKNKNKSEENEHWLNLGKKGLELSNKYFK